MVFQAIALILTAPLATNVVGIWLHDLTGRFNVEDFAGHCFFIAAAGATAHHALTRMEHSGKFVRHVIAPIAVAFFIRLYFFTRSQGSYTYTEDYFAMPEGFNTKIYWWVTCGIVIYLLLYTARIMAVLRRNPTHTRTANVYLFGAIVGVVTCCAKILDATFTAQSMQMPLVIWMGCCLGASGFAFGFGYSWRMRAKDLRGSRPVARLS